MRLKFLLEKQVYSRIYENEIPHVVGIIPSPGHDMNYFPCCTAFIWPKVTVAKFKIDMNSFALRFKRDLGLATVRIGVKSAK